MLERTDQFFRGVGEDDTGDCCGLRERKWCEPDSERARTKE
jgi:hypothetical protein